MRQAVIRELLALSKWVEDLRSALDDIDVSGGGAPVGAPFVTYAASGALSNELVLVDGTNSTINTSTPGQVAVDVTAGLSQEQVEDTVAALAVAGTGITISYNDAIPSLTIATTITQYTDELAQDAVGAMVANSSTVSLTYADATPSLTAAVIAGSIGTTQLTDDGVTFAKFQNIATNRLLGRDTAGSGNVEELTIAAPFALGSTTAGMFEFSEWTAESFYANPTGSDAVPVLVTPGNGLAWVGTTLEVSAGTIAHDVIYDVDYATLANNTLVNGAEVIDGIPHTAVNMGLLNNPRVLNGTGIVMPCAVSGGSGAQFNSAAQSAPGLYFELGSIPGFDPVFEYLIEFYFSSLTLETNGENVFVTLWGLVNSPFTSSAARSRSSIILNNAGTILHRSQSNNTSSDADGVAIPTHNVLALKWTPWGYTQGFTGVYAAGFPTLQPGAMAAGTGSVPRDIWNHSTCRIAFGIGVANDASPTTTVTWRRMRIRKLGRL